MRDAKTQKATSYWIWGCLIGILIIGFGLRVFSAYLNDQRPLGGDVETDAKAGLSFTLNRTFQVAPPSLEPSYYFSTRNGVFLNAHPILWPILGATLPLALGWSHVNIFSVFTSMQFFSFMSGLAMIVLAYILGKQRIGSEAGLVMAAFVSISYILIDFSANSALYMTQGALFLLWTIVMFRGQNSQTGEYEILRLFERSSVFFLALISAVAFMLSYLSICIPMATGICFLFLGKASWYERIQTCVLFSLLFIIFTLPLTIRNTATFGSPLASVNKVYMYQKAGLPEVVSDGIIRYEVDSKTLPLLAKAERFWTTHNFYYLNRKLFILMPIFYFFLVFSIIDYSFSRKLALRVAPILILLAIYSFFILAWPLIKFRFFVPLLPLLVFLACEYIYRVLQGRVRLAVVSAALASTAALSLVTYFETAPTGHTYYGDGAITSNPYGEGPDGSRIQSLYREDE